MLITEEYRQQQAYLHANTTYGVVGGEYAADVVRVMKQMQADALLDYGSGSRLSLLHGLRGLGVADIDYRPYDPAVPEYAADPEPCELVCCLDVLEHIEPELLDNVLDDLQRLTLSVGLFSIHSRPAFKTLPDGRNAHLIQEGAAWWLPKLLERFELQSFQRRKGGFVVIVTRLDNGARNI